MAPGGHRYAPKVFSFVFSLMFSLVFSVVYSLLSSPMSFLVLSQLFLCWHMIIIQLLESPIPTTAAAPVSQKASSDNISGTKRGTIDPLVSKRPEKILNKKIKKFK